MDQKYLRQTRGTICRWPKRYLAPAFDLNPDEDGTGLNINISLDDNSLDLNLALKVIDYFRLPEERAFVLIDQIKASVSRWRKVADKYGLKKTEQELMVKVFDRFCK